MWRWCQQLVRSTILRIPTLSHPRLHSKSSSRLTPVIDNYLGTLGSRIDTSRQGVSYPTTQRTSESPTQHSPNLNWETKGGSLISSFLNTIGVLEATPKRRTLLDPTLPKVVARRKSRTLKKFDALACSISSTPEDHATVVALKRFLAGGLHSSTSTKITPSNIRALFYSLKERSLLHHLLDEDITKLIALFGFLSIRRLVLSEGDMSQHPFLADSIFRLCRNMRKETRVYWDFVGMLGREKTKLGMSLSHSDRYWLMKGKLADVVNGSHAKNNPAEVSNATKQSMHWARVHYRSIASLYSHPEIHLPFFRALLSFGLVDEAVFRWTEMMKTQDCIPLVLRDFVWKILLEAGETMSSESKERLLQSVMLPLIGSTRPDAAILSLPDPPDTFQNHDASWQLSDLTKLILSYVTDPHTPPMHAPLSQWVSRVVNQNMLSPLDTETVYENLYFLALVTAPTSVLLSAQTPPLTSTSNISDFRLMCALVLCERIVGMQGRVATPLHEDVIDQLRPVVSHLWNAWHLRQHAFPPVVNMALLTSFTYLAGRIKQTQLLTSCIHEVVTLPKSIFTEPQYSLNVCHLIAEMAIARILHGEPIPVVINSIREYLEILGNAAEAISIVVARFCNIQPQLADQIELIARQSRLKLTAEAHRKISLALARQGKASLAYSHVREGDLSKKQKAQVFEAIAKGINTHKVSLDWELAGVLAADMRRTFRRYLPSLGSWKDLQETLWVIIDAGRPQEAVSIVRGIGVLKKDYFEPAFITKLIRTLTHRRYFQLSRIIFITFRQQHPSLAGGWYDFLLRKFHQAGAHDQWKILRKYRWTLPNRDVWNDLLYGQVHRRRGDVRRLASIAQSDAVPLRYHARWMKVMLNARVRRKSRMLYYHNQARYTPRLRSRMANDLIESIFRSNTNHPRSRLRIVLETMEEVRAHSEFTPDRVTFNIIMKGLLRLDRDFDARAIRTLFNHVIRSGYPNGGLGKAGHPVFLHDTEDALRLIKRFQVPVPDEKLSYERHVQPLYRMFVSALYVRGDIFGARKVLRVLKRVRAHEKGRKRRRWISQLKVSEAS
ncbi:hypothetical protein QCA50_005831 [Cerrena zonata]|uniref:Uncharacterized protein n=1 Tax=Cerrena zonata TaxID=2478898 RepID=A0AAW0GLC3_9APHY